MLLRIPDFYDSFHCIGSKCPDNCCIGWELDIDDDTYEYYRSVEGPFGDRLRANMQGAEESSDSGAGSFHLQVNGRCPFLNESNLCDICLELGPDALCRICTDYPRYSFEWGDIIEKSLTLSCPEAERLLFLNDIPVRFKEIPLNETGLATYMTEETYEEMGRQECEEDADDDLYCNEGEASVNGQETAPDEFEEDPEQIRKISLIRTECIRLLQDRSLSLDERIERYMRLCGTPDFSLTLSERLEMLSGMEILNDRWTSVMKDLEEKFASDEVFYRDSLQSYLASDDFRKYAYTYEHLLVYFTFRYFPRAAYDYDLPQKARFVFFCYLVIRDMDALRYADRSAFTFADRIETVKDFSKQVEHSDYNIDYLMEELLFS